MRADDIPVVYTPAGGWHGEMPAPFLTDCDEPLAPGVPDLRGTWQVVSVEVNGTVDPTHPVNRHVERIEQCGDRVTLTGGGIIHDMRADGTIEHGVHDVAARDYTTPIHVVATVEDDTLVLRPVDMPIEITRRIEGHQLVWTYVGFTARLERIDT